jgi:hypothetical protein
MAATPITSLLIIHQLAAFAFGDTLFLHLQQSIT